MPRYELAQRFVRSGREKLILLILSDHDPDGECIAQSFARSMRDDFSLTENQLDARKVALTPALVQKYQLPPSMDAKRSSALFPAFFAKYGAAAWELEAMTPDDLATELRSAVESAIDIDAFERERATLRDDARELESVRRAVLRNMRGLA